MGNEMGNQNVKGLQSSLHDGREADDTRISVDASLMSNNSSGSRNMGHFFSPMDDKIRDEKSASLLDVNLPEAIILQIQSEKLNQPAGQEELVPDNKMVASECIKDESFTSVTKQLCSAQENSKLEGKDDIYKDAVAENTDECDFATFSTPISVPTNHERASETHDSRCHAKIAMEEQNANETQDEEKGELKRINQECVVSDLMQVNSEKASSAELNSCLSLDMIDLQLKVPSIKDSAEASTKSLEQEPIEFIDGHSNAIPINSLIHVLEQTHEKGNLQDDMIKMMVFHVHEENEKRSDTEIETEFGEKIFNVLEENDKGKLEICGAYGKISAASCIQEEFEGTTKSSSEIVVDDDKSTSEIEYLPHVSYAMFHLVDEDVSKGRTIPAFSYLTNEGGCDVINKELEGRLQVLDEIQKTSDGNFEQMVVLSDKNLQGKNPEKIDVISDIPLKKHAVETEPELEQQLTNVTSEEKVDVDSSNYLPIYIAEVRSSSDTPIVLEELDEMESLNKSSSYKEAKVDDSYVNQFVIDSNKTEDFQNYCETISPRGSSQDDNLDITRPWEQASTISDVPNLDNKQRVSTSIISIETSAHHLKKHESDQAALVEDMRMPIKGSHELASNREHFLVMKCEHQMIKKCDLDPFGEVSNENLQQKYLEKVHILPAGHSEKQNPRSEPALDGQFINVESEKKGHSDTEHFLSLSVKESQSNETAKWWEDSVYYDQANDLKVLSGSSTEVIVESVDKKHVAPIINLYGPECLLIHLNSTKEPMQQMSTEKDKNTPRAILIEPDSLSEVASLDEKQPSSIITKQEDKYYPNIQNHELDQSEEEASTSAKELPKMESNNHSHLSMSKELTLCTQKFYDETEFLCAASVVSLHDHNTQNCLPELPNKETTSSLQEKECMNSVFMIQNVLKIKSVDSTETEQSTTSSSLADDKTRPTKETLNINNEICDSNTEVFLLGQDHMVAEKETSELCDNETGGVWHTSEESHSDGENDMFEISGIHSEITSQVSNKELSPQIRDYVGDNVYGESELHESTEPADERKIFESREGVEDETENETNKNHEQERSNDKLQEQKPGLVADEKVDNRMKGSDAGNPQSLQMGIFKDIKCSVVFENFQETKQYHAPLENEIAKIVEQPARISDIEVLSSPDVYGGEFCSAFNPGYNKITIEDQASATETNVENCSPDANDGSMEEACELEAQGYICSSLSDARHCTCSAVDSKRESRFSLLNNTNEENGLQEGTDLPPKGKSDIKITETSTFMNSSMEEHEEVKETDIKNSESTSWTANFVEVVTESEPTNVSHDLTPQESKSVKTLISVFEGCGVGSKDSSLKSLTAPDLEVKRAPPLDSEAASTADTFPPEKFRLTTTVASPPDKVVEVDVVITGQTRVSEYGMRTSDLEHRSLREEKMSVERVSSTSETSGSGKLRAPLLSLLKGDAKVSKEKDKIKRTFFKKTLDKFCKSPPTKSPGTSTGKKSRYSLFSGCMCCTTVIQ